MKKVQWGVLGTADIARGATIPGMLQAESCSLYAIAGRNPEKARAWQETFGFEKSYGSYDKLLADPAVEAVYIPLPNNLHCEWSIRALQAGKHVLCEKPLAMNEEQVVRMFQAAEENHVFLMEAFAYLHSPFVAAVKKELESGAVGEIRYVESGFIGGLRPDTDIRLQRETGGGAMYDLGCYPLSMVLWMLGREPEEIKATAQFSPRGVDLFTTVLLLYQNGPVAALDCGMLADAGRLDRFHILGTEGEIFSPVQFNQAGEIPYTVVRNGKAETKTVLCPHNYSLEVEQLSRCVRGEAVPHIPRDFSRMTARVMDRILAEIGW